jgi:hypothetical protein
MKLIKIIIAWIKKFNKDADNLMKAEMLEYYD